MRAISRRILPLLFCLLTPTCQALGAQAPETAENEILSAVCPRPSGEERRLAAVAAEARAAGIPGEDVDRLLAASIENRLAHADAAALLGLLMTARRENLALSHFLLRIREGLAKGVAGATIRDVLFMEIANHHFCRDLLLEKVAERGAAVTPEDVTNLEKVLEAGIGKSELAAFVREAPNAPPSMLATGAELWAFFRQAGFDDALGRDVVREGLEGRSLTPEWRYLSRVVALARGRDIGDEAIHRAAVQVLNRHGNISDVMLALDFAGRRGFTPPAPPPR